MQSRMRGASASSTYAPGASSEGRVEAGGDALATNPGRENEHSTEIGARLTLLSVNAFIYRRAEVEEEIQRPSSACSQSPPRLGFTVPTMSCLILEDAAVMVEDVDVDNGQVQK